MINFLFFSKHQKKTSAIFYALKRIATNLHFLKNQKQQKSKCQKFLSPSQDTKDLLKILFVQFQTGLPFQKDLLKEKILHRQPTNKSSSSHCH